MTALGLETIDLHSKDLYVTRGYPWEAWDLLRREAPVFWYERENVEPFWAVTRHADILEVSKHSEVFVNSRRLRIFDREDDVRQKASTQARIAARGWDPEEPPDFIFMDDPRHRDFRLLIAKRFTPAALRPLERHFAELSRQFAGELEAELRSAAVRGEVCDFVKGFAEKLPLAAIGEMMGLPPGDWKRQRSVPVAVSAAKSVPSSLTERPTKKTRPSATVGVRTLAYPVANCHCSVPAVASTA